MSKSTPQALIADLQARLSELLRSSPAADLERNVRALVGQAFQRFDLVTRDEFDAQLERLAHLQQRVAQLEKMLDERSDAGQRSETAPPEPLRGEGDELL